MEVRLKLHPHLLPPVWQKIGGPLISGISAIRHLDI